MPDTPSQNRLVSAWLRLPGNLRGVIWITVGSLAFAFNDGVIKHLGAKFDPLQLAFARYLVGLVILGPVFISMGASGLSTKRFGLHMTRLIMACIAQVGVFYAIIHLYLADATAIAFSRPLFTTIVAVFLLSELVSARRWIATLVGFAGVMIMVRPGHAGFDPVALIAICVGAYLCRRQCPDPPDVRYRAAKPDPVLLPCRRHGHIPRSGNLGVADAGRRGMVYSRADWRPDDHRHDRLRPRLLGRRGQRGRAHRIYPAYLRRHYWLCVFRGIPSPWTFIGAIVIVVSALYIARDESRRPAPPLPDTHA